MGNPSYNKWDGLESHPTRASGGSRTHTLRITGAVLGQLSFAGKYPREESNPILDVRSVECLRHTPGTWATTPTRIRTWTSTFAGSHAVRCTIRAKSVPSASAQC